MSIQEDTQAVLHQIEAFQRRFVHFPDDAYLTATTLWIAHTWAFEASYCTPYIYANSAEKRSGKTRLMETLAALARNPIMAADTSAAGLFRHIEGDSTEEDESLSSPTIFVDEADTIWTGGGSAEDLRGVLNSGYKHNGSVLRATGRYSTYAPKMLAGIDNGGMPDTIRDRSIMLTLKRKPESVVVERWHERKVAPVAEALQDALMEWASEAVPVLRDSEPEILDGVSDRAFDIAEPLLAIADLAGDEWSARARTDLRGLLQGETEALSPGMKVLMAASQIMADDDTSAVFSRELEEATGIPAKAIGNILKPYGISPTTIRKNGDIAKGYRADFFTDAWERYL